jgi:hypothetical protein
MRTVIVIALTFFFLPSAASASEQLPLAKQIVQNAKRDCNGFESGEFYSTERTITLHDLTGDGRPEEVVDASQLSCSTALTLWGGSGGTYLWVIVDGKAHEFLAHRWKVVEFDGKPLLLLAVHSSQCGDTIGPCYRALVWDNGFKTTQEPFE